MIFQIPTPAQERYMNMLLNLQGMESAEYKAVSEFTIGKDEYVIFCDKWKFRAGTEYEMTITCNGEEIWRYQFCNEYVAVEFVADAINELAKIKYP